MKHNIMAVEKNESSRPGTTATVPYTEEPVIENTEMKWSGPHWPHRGNFN